MTISLNNEVAGVKIRDGPFQCEDTRRALGAEPMWFALVAVCLIALRRHASSNAFAPPFDWLGRSRRNVPSFPADDARMSLLIFLALLVVFNPEVRALLLFIDAIGIDVLLLLILFQLQMSAAFIRREWIANAWRSLCNWGPIPFQAPTWQTLRRSPVIAVYAAVSPAFAVGLLLSMMFLAYTVALTAVRV
jgi:hypothetical protein